MTAIKPVAVGAFVLGGLALGVAAILVFGGMRLFTRGVHAVAYFPGSVAGLSVGAPVTFRGVKVGAVEGMTVHVNVPDLKPVIPVTLDLDPSQLSWTSGPPAAGDTDLRRAVQLGLRAQLVAQSLVTGQLAVDLDFRPATPATLVGPPGALLEIPAITSDMQHLKDQLVDLNLPKLADQARQALTSLQRILDQADGRIGPMADAARTTLVAATAAVHELQVDAARTLANIDQLAAASRRQVTSSGSRLDQALAKATQALAQADTLLVTLNEVTASRSPMRADLQASIRDLAASASSLRVFTRDLQRNPAGTLLGRSR